jgi:hypothetical protein
MVGRRSIRRSGSVMAVDPNDWRVASGQERWCRGLVFKRARWAPTPTIRYKPDGTTEPAVWDHDHCEFCWQEFSTDHDCGDGSRPLTEGYTARGPAGHPEQQRRDNYHWVCPTCFEDFKDYFGWTISRP